MYFHRLYGLVVAADRPLPAPRIDAAADIVITEHAARRPTATPPNLYGYSYHILTDGSIHVTWSGHFDFVVSADGARVDVHAESPLDAEPAYVYLLSQVISVALLQQGIESFHASAVAIDGRAFMLLGESGYGKSTLTAALVRAGARLITDDLLVLSNYGAHYDAVPGALRVKLAPDTAERLGLSWAGIPMADGSGKYSYRPDETSYVSQNTPLERIIVLEPHAQTARTESVSVVDTTRALLAATFNPLHAGSARLQTLLSNAHALAQAVPATRLHVPRELTAVAEVIAHIH